MSCYVPHLKRDVLRDGKRKCVLKTHLMLKTLRAWGESPPSPRCPHCIWCNQSTVDFLGCKCTLLGHGELLTNQLMSFSSGLLLILFLSSLYCAWDFCPPRGHWALLNFTEFSWSLSRSFSMASLSSSMLTTPHHTAWWCWETFWGYTQSHSPCCRQRC